MSKIIGVCGFIGSGKNSVADRLVTHHGFEQMSFAKTLKDTCSAIFGWDREMLEGVAPGTREQREVVDLWWAERLGRPNWSPRVALQYMGTEVMRDSFHQDIWVLATERALIAAKEAGRSVVFSDVRFPNEFNMLRHQGASIVQVSRGQQPAWYDEVVKLLTPKGNPKEAAEWADYSLTVCRDLTDNLHESEWLWLAAEMDGYINNDGSMEDLYKQVEALAS